MHSPKPDNLNATPTDADHRSHHRPKPVTLADSQQACHILATTHYENFSVLSSLLPQQYRADFTTLYAFCRLADDAADERNCPETSLKELAELRYVITTCANTTSTDKPTAFDLYQPAWQDLIHRHRLTEDPFCDLIAAFVQDQHKSRYADWDDLLHYCKGSANPVGRLVLHITGNTNTINNDTMMLYSDATCTALQLTNMWQDVARDLTEHDRIYIPQDALQNAGITEHDLLQLVHQNTTSPQFQQTLSTLTNNTWPLFAKGRKLWPFLNTDTRPSIQLFTAGGEAILRAIEKQNYNVLKHRPTIGKLGKATLLLRAWFGAQTGLDLFKPQPKTCIYSNVSLENSYDYCARLTKTQAKNFYYGLRLTPEPKRSSLYAIYAWMRFIDDLADSTDSAMMTNAPTSTDRIAAINAFRKQTELLFQPEYNTPTLKTVHHQHTPNSPCSKLMPAFQDTIARYQLHFKPFEDMIQGQLMDVTASDQLQFDTFDDLYQYCYRVASTVGLICVQIWGENNNTKDDISDHITQLAIKRGIAFQLTNIIRDFTEDWATHNTQTQSTNTNKRLYLPLEDFKTYNITPQQLTTWAKPKQCLEFMQFQIDRARSYYIESEQLEQLLDPDCAGTSWAMNTLYRNILEKIASDPQLAITKGRPWIRLSSYQKSMIALSARYDKPWTK